MSQWIHGAPRVAFISGAGSGIGLQVAKALVGEGASVALMGRTEAKVVAAADELLSVGAPSLALGGDVTKPADIERCVAATVEAFGGIGYHATTPAELTRALLDAIAAGKPALINAVIDESAGTESGRLTNLNPQSAAKK